MNINGRKRLCYAVYYWLLKHKYAPVISECFKWKLFYRLDVLWCQNNKELICYVTLCYICVNDKINCVNNTNELHNS